MSLLSHQKGVAVKVGWTAESGPIQSSSGGGTQLLNEMIVLVR